MPSIDVVVETKISNSVRARQVSSMFDVPAEDRARQEWRGDLPIEERDWNVGLIVGPSGCGKSTILREVFGEPNAYEWSSLSVIDDFDRTHRVQEIAQICQAVGFNTIPAWLRPYGVLSNGEKFRVDLARRLLDGGEVVVCDEFTSVVDRQVARIGSHAVQKHIRRAGRKFVAATCHFDLEDWLQPDWVLEPATMAFRWRSVQRRPGIDCVVRRVPYEMWTLFSRFHYLTAALNRSARCFALFVEGRPAAFSAVLYRPHPKVANVYGLSRTVTLPDWQGLGLAFALTDRLGAAYRALGRRLRAYPAHPAYIRNRDKSPLWKLVRQPGLTNNVSSRGRSDHLSGALGGRPNATFEYIGPAMEREQAALLIG